MHINFHRKKFHGSYTYNCENHENYVLQKNLGLWYSELIKTTEVSTELKILYNKGIY